MKKIDKIARKLGYRLVCEHFPWGRMKGYRDDHGRWLYAIANKLVDGPEMARHVLFSDQKWYAKTWTELAVRRHLMAAWERWLRDAIPIEEPFK